MPSHGGNRIEKGYKNSTSNGDGVELWVKFVVSFLIDWKLRSEKNDG